MNNSVVLSGEIISGCKIKVMRDSGAYDIIPLSDNARAFKNRFCVVSGKFISIPMKNGNLTKYALSVMAYDIIATEYKENLNDIFLDGTIEKTVYRMTPGGRRICEIVLKADENHIPCICWGYNAEKVRDLELGHRIRVAGRIQSREYGEGKMTYEVSVGLVEIG